MKIGEFADYFMESRRNIDYWTNIGLLRPDVNEKNGYREYGDRAIEDMKLILIAKAMNYEKITLPRAVKHVKELPKESIELLLQTEMRRMMNRYAFIISLSKTLKED